MVKIVHYARLLKEHLFIYFVSKPTGSNSQPSEGHRRDDNPFSFKHFLRSDSNNSHQSKGARPKVYTETRSQSTDYGGYESKQSKLAPEFSSALPDFVQDHLVMEQCFLGNNLVKNYDHAVGNLPDFTPNRENRNGDSREDNHNVNIQVPLDLPFRQQTFPLDLPISGSSGNSTRNNQAIGEVSLHCNSSYKKSLLTLLLQISYSILNKLIHLLFY